jgi:hypothetical protein
MSSRPKCLPLGFRRAGRRRPRPRGRCVRRRASIVALSLSCSSPLTVASATCASASRTACSASLKLSMKATGHSLTVVRFGYDHRQGHSPENRATRDRRAGAQRPPPCGSRRRSPSSHHSKTPSRRGGLAPDGRRAPTHSSKARNIDEKGGPTVARNVSTDDPQAQQIRDISPRAKAALRGRRGPEGPQGPPGISSITEASATLTIAPTGKGTAVATCPAGLAPISGGYVAGASTVTVQVNRRSEGRGWEVGASGPAGVSMLVYAYCAAGISGQGRGESVEKAGRNRAEPRLVRQRKPRVCGASALQGRQDSNLQPPVLETGALPN